MRLAALLPVVEGIGWSALASLVVAWLVVSFSAPGPRRDVVEWFGASALYAALLSLFLHLLAGALERQSRVAIAAFGFLVTFFSVGLLVCLWQTASSLRGPRARATSATH